jgi:D-alanyl-D-alanine carboxypeptidase/D-alanyl-D-alanine-endopeptidase (penicillin-binding protein 4)
MTTMKSYASFYNTLPVSGKSGTLSNFCKDQPGHGRIAAKSGTMGRIKSYAGYIHSKSGKKMAFAVIVTNYNSSSSSVTRKIEKLLNALAVY